MTKITLDELDQEPDFEPSSFAHLFGLRVARAEHFVSRILNFLIVLLLCLSTLLAVAAVFLRFGFSVSYGVLEELCRYTVVYAVLLAFGPLITRNSHLTMGLVVDRLSPAAFRIFDICLYLILTVVLFVLFLGAYRWEDALVMMGLQTMSGAMKAWIPSAALPIGLFIAMIYALIRVIYRFCNVPLNVFQVNE